MRIIYFSHIYVKMPKFLFEPDVKTEVFQVFTTEYDQLGEKYIKWDTAYIEGKETLYYPLPKGKLIVIELLTNHPVKKISQLWQTIRRWTPQKEKYYRSAIGQEAKIICRKSP